MRLLHASRSRHSLFIITKPARGVLHHLLVPSLLVLAAVIQLRDVLVIDVVVEVRPVGFGVADYVYRVDVVFCAVASTCA